MSSSMSSSMSTSLGERASRRRASSDGPAAHTMLVVPGRWIALAAGKHSQSLKHSQRRTVKDNTVKDNTVKENNQGKARALHLIKCSINPAHEHRRVSHLVPVRWIT